jgi:hypothetical protein
VEDKNLLEQYQGCTWIWIRGKKLKLGCGVPEPILNPLPNIWVALASFRQPTPTGLVGEVFL